MTRPKATSPSVTRTSRWYSRPPPGAAPHSASTSCAEPRAALLEVLGTGRSSRRRARGGRRRPARRRRARPATACSRSPECRKRTPAPRSASAISSAGLADQVRARDARLAGARARARRTSVPLRLPPRITRSPGGYAPSARSAASGFVAFESLTQRTPSSSRTSSSRCGHAGEASRSAVGDRLVGDAGGARSGRGARPRSRGCAPRDARLGRQRVVGGELDPAGRARHSAGSRAGRPRRRPGSWFSKMRSFAAR